MHSAATPVARLRICAGGPGEEVAAARSVRDALNGFGLVAELLLTPGADFEAVHAQVRAGEADAIVLPVGGARAVPGLVRAAVLERKVSAASAVDVPAPAAGAFALWVRENDTALPTVSRLNHPPTARDVAFECAVVDACTGTAFAPLGACVIGGGVLVALLRGTAGVRRVAAALHAGSDAHATAMQVLSAAIQPAEKRILLTRSFAAGAQGLDGWAKEAGWTLLHEPLISFAPTGHPVPLVEPDDRRSKWVWVHSPQAAEYGLPAGFPAAEWQWACSSRAAAASLPTGSHPDWIGHSAPGEAMREFAAFIGPLGPADVLIPHSDSSVPRWEEAFRPYPAVRLHAWQAYAATNRDEGTLPAHDAAVIGSPAAMKAWKHRWDVHAVSASVPRIPVLIAVHSATADAGRDLGCTPHAVSETDDAAAVWEALVWALAVEAEAAYPTR